MRFWGKDRKQDNRKNIWIEHLNIDTENWFQVFSACFGKMIAIQTACSEQVVKGQDWNVDFSASPTSVQSFSATSFLPRTTSSNSI